MDHEVELADVAATRTLGERLGAAVRAERAGRVPASAPPSGASGLLVLLDGPLGAGKTMFAQGVAVGLGVAERPTSPTFVLAREVRGPSSAGFTMLHVDLYRLAADSALHDLGVEEALDEDAVVVVEWAGTRPEIRELGQWLAVTLSLADGGRTRRARLTAHGPHATAVLDALRGV